jgi:hypothetical protein
MDITNLKEAGIAVASLISGYQKAYADGKVSIFEHLGVVTGNAGKVIAAIKDAGQILPELKDLKPHEFEEFYLAVIVELNLEDNNIARRRVGAIYDLVLAALQAVDQWSDEVTPLPEPPAPRAQIVDENYTMPDC